MPILNLSPQGRFGNVCMQLLWARGMAHRYGYELRCDEWVGDRIWDDVTPRYVGPALPRYNELTLQAALQRGEDCEFRGYGQMGIQGLVSPARVRLISNLMPYSKKQAQQWLKIRSAVKTRLDAIMRDNINQSGDRIVAHRRVGDYSWNGSAYPVISRHSYTTAAHRYFGNWDVDFVEEEKPLPHTDLHDDLSFLPDFYRLTQAPTLLRGNSSFSFVAGVLSDGVVLSPRIDGLVGGREHHVQFEPGNHCRLAEFDFCSELHLAP